MLIGIISYYDYSWFLNQKYDKSFNKKYGFEYFESWHKAWDEVFKLSKNYKIKIEKYNTCEICN